MYLIRFRGVSPVFFVENNMAYRFRGVSPVFFVERLKENRFKGRQPCVLRRKIERKPVLRGVSPVFFVENNMANCLIFEQTILIFLLDQTDFPGAQNLLP